ncbi:rhodanese-like domain-containing protein [Kluyvera intermedia]|uniref:Rhodanese-like domain-containing protein n=1 Tax=Kluyvera intermedia TaxID=61648 RepID=A0AA95G3Y8_KLUIN|nr:rhodanese-like domain-containing protein [Kluyvera intermedia]WGL58167.1 rhodanese-like domain-containing protein [Kluyvera intermedia]
MSYVTEFPAVHPVEAAAHFRQRLACETDCADVYASLQQPAPDFVLLHVVGSPEMYSRRHIPGAIHLRHIDITAKRMQEWPADTVFVVYCAGPHCNGADRAALKLAILGRPVKVMIGGITGWQDEGFAFSTP